MKTQFEQMMMALTTFRLFLLGSKKDSRRTCPRTLTLKRSEIDLV